MPRPQDEERARRQAMDARLGREQTIWLATARSDGRPHLAPVWFAWHNERIYFCTGAASQKMVNLERRRHAAVALPDTSDVLIIEGTIDFPLGATIDELDQQFYDKYGWSFLTDQTDDWRLVELFPTKVLAWTTDQA